ncbi:MAG: SUMF1/EgtB/PvdO family nonheme iron enzyme [Hyphomonadaceae bacterium]|nr:SUMF1/EgtB/PvdO family nonheme iron enzyme [Hyphomonadaceae bacterium]
MTDIFLSYSRADRPKAQIMAQALEEDGFTVWWDKVLRAGQTYDEVTETMLRDAHVVIVLWSETSVKSKWVRAEATLGQRNCELVPAMIEDAERPIMFELVQTADLIGWDGDRSDPRWKDFIDDIQRSLEKAKSDAAAAPPSEPAAPVPQPVAPPAAAPVAPAPSAAPPAAQASVPIDPAAKKPKKSSSPLPMLLVALAVLGGGGYYAYANFIAPGDKGDVIEDTVQIVAPTCDLCPEMSRIEGGTFTIGSPNTERHHSGNETPQTEITLTSYWMSKTEITWENWEACVEDGGCSVVRGGGEASMPVTGVNWNEATAYADWLSTKSGFTYRLPSEAEWEYAARGGTSTAYWWGDSYPGAGVVSGAARDTSTLTENAFGVSGMLGNVREWVADCYLNNYSATPTDGRPSQGGDCNLRVVRGGSFELGAAEHRAANRARYRRTIRDGSLGFRVVAEQP